MGMLQIKRLGEELTRLMKLVVDKLSDWGSAASYAIHH